MKIIIIRKLSLGKLILSKSFMEVYSQTNERMEKLRRCDVESK